MIPKPCSSWSIGKAGGAEPARGRYRFRCARQPEANRMMVGIMAMVAEQEREALSQRTKDALAAKKAQGVKLGNPRPETLTFNDPAIAAAAAVKAGAAVREQADQFAELIRPLLQGELAGLSANASAH